MDRLANSLRVKSFPHETFTYRRANETPELRFIDEVQILKHLLCLSEFLTIIHSNLIETHAVIYSIKSNTNNNY